MECARHDVAEKRKPMKGTARTMRTTTNSRGENSARSLLAGRDATGGKESKPPATWEIQIEQGACSKPAAVLSSSFPFSRAASDSRDEGDACRRTRRPLAADMCSSSASDAPSGDIKCRANGTRSIRCDFHDASTRESASAFPRPRSTVVFDNGRERRGSPDHSHQRNPSRSLRPAKERRG